eukprot:TRINITY_DN7469_c0_g1_i1.p1 TRINITY_DN7469_c0_g1~~TRINITY_DN7469_c0_g1_i1.p1  ORF type:complete len:653 (-),score=138.57 TRINITY_DN7469_c0_g1_i1:101-2059(-)
MADLLSDGRKRSPSHGHKFKILKRSKKKKNEVLSPEKTNNILMDLINYILEKGTTVDHIFLNPYQLPVVKGLKKELSLGQANLEDWNINEICGVLLLTLRELEDPLIPFSLYDHILDTSDVRPFKVRLKVMRAVFDTIPPGSRLVLERLLYLCQKIIQNINSCHVSIEALAIVLSPLLIRNPENDQEDEEKEMCIEIVEVIIDNFSSLFEDSIEVSNENFSSETQNVNKSTDEQRIQYRKKFLELQKNYIKKHSEDSIVIDDGLIFKHEPTVDHVVPDDDIPILQRVEDHELVFPSKVDDEMMPPPIVMVEERSRGSAESSEDIAHQNLILKSEIKKYTRKSIRKQSQLEKERKAKNLLEKELKRLKNKSIDQEPTHDQNDIDDYLDEKSIIEQEYDSAIIKFDKQSAKIDEMKNDVEYIYNRIKELGDDYNELEEEVLQNSIFTAMYEDIISEHIGFDNVLSRASIDINDYTDKIKEIELKNNMIKNLKTKINDSISNNGIESKEEIIEQLVEQNQVLTMELEECMSVEEAKEVIFNLEEIHDGLKKDYDRKMSEMSMAQYMEQENEILTSKMKNMVITLTTEVKKVQEYIIKKRAERSRLVDANKDLEIENEELRLQIITENEKSKEKLARLHEKVLLVKENMNTALDDL